MRLLIEHTNQIVTAVIILIFSIGCINDPLDRAEDLIAAYDFRSALAVLDQITGEEHKNDRFHRLHALTLFVEGRTDEGFAEINAVSADDPENQRAYARALFDAAFFIIREKNRVNEAIMLLDSCDSYNPDYKQQIQNLVWSRALEYFAVPGDGGFRLISFAAKSDEGILKRLRSRNRIYYNRYDEIRSVYQVQELLKVRIKLFHNNRSRFPRDYRELVDEGFTAGVAIPKGWRVELFPDAGGGYILTAEALKDNLGKVLVGTVLKVYGL